MKFEIGQEVTINLDKYGEDKYPASLVKEINSYDNASDFYDPYMLAVVKIEAMQVFKIIDIDEDVYWLRTMDNNYQLVVFGYLLIPATEAMKVLYG